MPEDPLGSVVPGPARAAILASIESLLAEDELRIDLDEFSPGAARVRTHPLGCEVLIDASWREHSAPSSNSGRGPRSWTVRRTFVFLHRPSLTFPEFELLPRGSFGDRILAGLSSLLGVPTLELDGHPEFSTRYTIVTANGESVRALLSREALDALAAFDDLRIKVGPHGVLAHRAIGSSWSDGRDRDERLDEAARGRFFADALAACSLFANDPVAAKRAESAVAGTYREEATETLSSTGGLVGHLLQRHLVTAEMIESIREHPPPRADIPPPIARRAWRGTTFPLLLLLAFCLAFPSLGIALLLKTAPDGDDRLVGAIFTAFGAVAIVIWSFILRHRLTRQRLVRRGLVIEASIAKVERTNTTVNNDRIHRIHFEDTGEPAPIIVKVGSAEAKLARALQTRGARTWVLQDPARPSRALWIAGWASGDGAEPSPRPAF